MITGVGSYSAEHLLLSESFGTELVVSYGLQVHA